MKKSDVIMCTPVENISSGLTRPLVPPVTNSNGSPQSTMSTTGGMCPMPFKLRNHETKHKFQDHLHNKTFPCGPDSCQGSVINEISSHNPGIPYTKQELFTEAEDFLRQYYQSINLLDSGEHQTRWINVRNDISLTGTYEHTYDERVFAAKTAWRNAPRCIGRQQWHKLEVFDHRHITSAQEMFDALCHHVKFSTNEGKIIPALTAFPQRRPGYEDFRLWNNQLIHYAGYLQPDGTVVGDPIEVEFTKACELLGWKGKGGRFDVLPLILQAPGNEPEWFELPSDIVMEVKLIHPRYDWFAELGLQWFVLPAVSGMMMDAGGIQYPALPFSGWYMSTEVGARDLCDVQRYNIAYDVADRMGLDTSNNTTLWKDQVLIECNIAVLHSFQRAGATIQDHHTLSESFMRHFKQETQLRGGCPSDWLWIVPPMSGSLCTVFHQEMMLYDIKPGYYWQGSPWRDLLKKHRKVRRCSPWKMLIPAIKFYTSMVLKLRNSREPCTILYASESGKSERFAHRIMETMNKMFRTTVSLMDDYNVQDLKREKFILFVTSTYGSGDPPQNGKAFFKKIKILASTCTPDIKKQMKTVRYSIFGLGSTAYQGTYCQFSKTLNTIMQGMGATQIANIGLGDELNHQDRTFVQWANIVTKRACRVFDICQEAIQGVLLEGDTETWTTSTFRTMPTATGRSADILLGVRRLR